MNKKTSKKATKATVTTVEWKDLTFDVSQEAYDRFHLIHSLTGNDTEGKTFADIVTWHKMEKVMQKSND